MIENKVGFHIIGTDHLMSKEVIYDLIKKENPDVIAVELCETRYALMVTPLLNNLIDERPKDESLLGKISSKIKEKADKEGLQYGSDQINACLYAKENNLPLEFVDLDITKTKYLMDLIPENEKNGFLLELQEFEKKTLKEQTQNIDEEKTLIELKERFPISFEFLVNMRNLVIINNILKLEKKYPYKKVLVILGKGHTKIVEGAIKW
jgi:pheromone shutdown protein TraB